MSAHFFFNLLAFFGCNFASFRGIKTALFWAKKNHFFGQKKITFLGKKNHFFNKNQTSEKPVNFGADRPRPHLTDQLSQTVARNKLPHGSYTHPIGTCTVHTHAEVHVRASTRRTLRASHPCVQGVPEEENESLKISQPFVCGISAGQ